MEGARRYISAFQAPLQELSLAQIHALRACSLLVIPPPKERVPPPGGFPSDLSDLNLSSWAGLIQDVASSLLTLPPNLGSDMGLPAVALLELLEKATGWGYCRYCCHLGSRCICMGAYSPAPPPSWSQVVDQSPGYGAIASSGGMTTPSTTAAGMSGYVPLPPGLPPIDFSNWRLPPPEAPASRGLPAAPPSLPGVGRSVNLRGTAKRIVGAQMARRPGPTDAGTSHISAVHTPNGTASSPTTTRAASHVSAVRASNGIASSPTATRAAGHAISASGTTTKEARGEGSRCCRPHR